MKYLSQSICRWYLGLRNFPRTLLNYFVLNAICSWAKKKISVLENFLRPKYLQILWHPETYIFKKKYSSHICMSLRLSPAVSFWKFVITNTSHTKVQVNWLPGATIFASSEKPSHLFLRSVFRWQCGVWEMHDDIFARHWDFPLLCHSENLLLQIHPIPKCK